MTGFDHAKREIFAGRAQARSLWVLLSTEQDRDGYALKPSPWEGPGEYQHVIFSPAKDLGVLVRLPDHRGLPKTAEAA